MPEAMFGIKVFPALNRQHDTPQLIDIRGGNSRLLALCFRHNLLVEQTGEDAKGNKKRIKFVEGLRQDNVLDEFKKGQDWQCK